MTKCASLKKHIQYVLEDKLFARERISELIKDFFFFFYVQHIIKSVPIVIVPNQPPHSILLLSPGIDSAPGCWSISQCNSKAVKLPYQNRKYVFSFSNSEDTCGGKWAVNKRTMFNGFLDMT